MSRQRVAIVDYGMGNLRSVSNALHSLECRHEVVSDPADVGRSDKAIVPGVGAFQEAIENLTDRGLRAALEGHLARGKAILGVCLGMQLFFTESSEDGRHDGLGWIPGTVKRLEEREGLKVPHMGWNSLKLVSDNPLLNGVASESDVYFVHSYVVSCDDASNVLATTRHGIDFPSIVAKDNVYGMQFHPEKSQQVGIRLLKNFLAL